MNKAKCFTILMILTVFSVTLSSFGALSGTLIGTKQINDWDYTPVQKYWSNNELGTPEEGYMDAGRVHFYFRNDEASAVTITNLMINGTNFYDTPYCPILEGRIYEEDSKWYMAWPQTVQPGEVCAVWMRHCDLPTIIGSGSATFTVQCDSDAFTFNFDPSVSPMTIPVINIESNLSDIIVYMGNTGTSDITLKSWGGLEINGVAVTGSLPTTTLSPGKVVPMSYSLSAPLTLYSQVVYQVTANDGTTTAIGHMRTFPSRFDVTYWYQGGEWDTTDAVLHNANINVPGQDHVRDEPAADGPATQFIDEVYSFWSSPSNTSRKLMVQQTGLFEGSVFNGIWDVTMSHRDDEDFFYAYHNAWPQPNWFVPFNAWAISEEANFVDAQIPERWPSLEGTFLTSARAIGWGAKQLQWFMYMTIWDQGYDGRSGGTDYAHQFQDRYQVGAVDNPLLWKRLARANAVAQTVRPYLNHSCHYHRSEKQGDFEVSTVLSGTNRAVVAITDDRTPPSYPEFLDGYVRYGVQALYDQTVQVKVPSFTLKDKAYLIHPFSGVTNIPMTVIDSETVELDVDEIIGGVVVVIGDSSDGAALEAEWAQTHKYDVDNLVAQSTMRGSNDGEDWYYTNLNFRTVVRVTNTTGSSQTLLGLPVDLPNDLMISSNSLRVVEIKGTATNQVQFFAEPSKKFEDFSNSSILSRFTYDNSNGTSSWQNSEVIFTAPLIDNASGNPVLDFKDGAADRWISAEYDCAVIEVNIADFPAVQQQQWIMQFDYDGDNVADETVTEYNNGILDGGIAGSIESLSNEWSRFFINPRALSISRKGTDLPVTGQWRLRILDAFSITSGTELDGQWKMRRFDLSGLRTLRVKPSGLGLGNGQSCTYHVYYDDPSNGVESPSALFNNALSGSYPTNMAMVNLGTEKGGGDVTASVGSDSVSVVTDVDVDNILLRHVDSDGLIISETMVSASSAQNFSTTLSQNMAAGDKLIIVPIQPSGLGNAFVYNDDGSSYAPEEETDQHAVQVWSAAVTDLRPYSMDMASDGSLIAVGYQTNLVVYNNAGSVAWTTNYNQRLGFNDFTEDDQYIYIAANARVTARAWDEAALYEDSNWQIIKANATTGAEIWRHQVGSGVVSNSANLGRTVFDLQVTPDGGVIYGEWNGWAIKLSSGGSVVWSNRSGGNYPLSIKLMGTNAVLLSEICEIIANDGSTIGPQYQLDDGMAYAIGASRNGDTWAYAGKSLRIVTNGSLSATVYLGRVPRVIAVSTNGDLVAAGTMDGTVALLRKNGDIIWTNYNPASIVADLDFTPDGSGLIVTREVFTYNHDRSSPWMMHDLVEAYNLSGTKYWQDAGPDHTQSFMNQTDISEDGTEYAVFTGNLIRYATNNVPILFPTIEPFGGPFVGTQEVVLACATPGATIYYTTDGSAPTNTSSVYSSPISVTADTTVRAVAVLSGDWSVETMAEFDEQAAAPTFNPAPGTFGVSVTVSVSTVTGGADLYYTLDGSDPTTNSTEYTTPLVFTKDTTLKSIAVKDGVSSAVSAGAYSITNRVLMPGIGPDQNTQNYYVDVFITCSTPGASIYYTTNGAAPSTNTLLYSAPFRLWTNAQVRAIAVKDGLNNSLQAAKTYTIIRKVRTPVFTPASGSFTTSVNVAISTDPSDATLYYTTDGTDPNTGSSVYSSPLNITDSTTVKVYGVRSTFTDSDIETAVFYEADVTPPTAPGNLAVSDLYGSSLRLTWSASTDDRGVVRYEISRDGSVIATNTSAELDLYEYDLSPITEYDYVVTAYDAAGNSAAATTTVMTLYNLVRNPSFEWDEDGNSFPDHWGSANVESSWGVTNHSGSRSYRIDGKTNFTYQYRNQSILLASDTEYKIAFWIKGENVQGPGALIRYIELDDQFHIRSTSYSKGTDTWQKVSATFTTDTNLTNGRFDLLWEMSNGVVWVDDIYMGYPEGDITAAADPVLAPAGGGYGSSINVTMTCSTVGADIYYTTDGSDPTTSDTLYTAPVAVSSATTLKAIAVRMGLDNSGITTESYTIDSTPPTQPGSFHVAYTNGRSIYLEWTASTDASGIAGYRVLRDGTVLGTTTNLTYVDTTTAITSSYTYGVAAYDNSGLYSTTSEVAVTTTANLLQNPSLEEGSPWPANWGRQNLAIASNDTTVAYEGSKSFVITPNGTNNYYSNQSVYPPIPGVEYTISCWVKTTNVSGGNGLYFRWVRLDGTGNLIENTPWSTGNQDWTYVEKKFTINSDVTYGRVDIVWDFTNGTVYVDKLYMGTTNAPSSPDADGDGMDDSWEVANFGNTTTATTNTDYDSDGFLDYAEYIAGTQPTNTASFLQALGSQSDVVLDDFVIQWTSASGKAYSLEYSTNLIDYITVQTNIQSVAPANNSWTVDIQSLERSYYRIKVDQ